MNNLSVLIKKEFLEISKTKKLLLLAIIFLFVAITSPITAKLLPLIFKSIDTQGITFNIPTPTYLDSIDQFVKNISQLATFILIFIVAGAISDEKANKTLEIVLAKPISRTNFILAKFIAYFLTIIGLFALSSLIFYSYTVTTFTTFSFINFSALAGLILLQILMLVSITLLASTISKNNIGAAGIGLFISLVVLPLLDLIKWFKDFSPNYIYSTYKDILAHGLTSAALKMPYHLAATAIALLHLAFILFVVAGGLLVLRWRRLMVLHIPAAIWGVLVEFAGWYCPLTTWENYFRSRAGESGYGDGFIEHYVFALIYPTVFPRWIAIVLGAFVLVVNAAIYLRVFQKSRAN